MPFDLGYPSSHYASSRPLYRGTSLQDVFARFPDNEACLSHVFSARFGDPARCPKCDRVSIWHRQSGTRKFRCSCGHNLSPMADTLFERTRHPLSLWIYAMLHMANSSEGVTVLFMQRHLGVAHKAAWRMLDRIRLHMAAIDFPHRLGAPGEDLFVRIEDVGAIRKAGRFKRKVAKLFLVADRQHVQATVIERPRQSVLRRIVADKGAKGARVVTNCYITYRATSEAGTRRPFADFVPDYFSERPELLDPISSYMVRLRRSLHHVHRRIDHRNLWKYLKEYEFRFNRRHRSQQIFSDLVQQFPALSPKSCQKLEDWSSRLPDITKAS